MFVHITSHLRLIPTFSYMRLIYIYMNISIFLIKQIVVEGDEISNPTECITQYPISDTADNSGTYINFSGPVRSRLKLNDLINSY